MHVAIITVGAFLAGACLGAALGAYLKARKLYRLAGSEIKRAIGNARYERDARRLREKLMGASD